jgi:hypothetical protein
MEQGTGIIDPYDIGSKNDIPGIWKKFQKIGESSSYNY